MKKFYLLIVAILFSLFCEAQEAFITTWEVTSDDLDIIIYTSSDYSYNYNIDFGDGTVLNNVSGDSQHSYTAAGVYTVTITGLFSQFLAANENKSDFINPLKLLTVEQWGNLQWLSMDGSFYNCQNMNINATDLPDLSQVTNMRYMFYNCNTFNAPLSSWDVSNVTDMSLMFQSCELFNQPLDNWDVSNVTDMNKMFKDCITFNQPLDNWSVSSVTNMSSMFSGCEVFNEQLSSWSTSSVTNMSFMFTGCEVFNQSLTSWDVSNVTDMSHMFSDCFLFNQPLNNWDVSNVTNMGSMFTFCKEFNQPLSNWNVSNVTNISYMFKNCYVFNQPLDNWDVSSVTNMSVLFQDCEAFNQPLTSWNVSNVTNMYSLFSGCDVFNQPLDNWDVSNVTTMRQMFLECYVFNRPLDNWDVSNVTDMRFMFRSCSAFNQPLNNWDVSNVINMRSMFLGCSDFNQPLDSWDFSMVGDLKHFASNSGLNVVNYDGLLFQFANSGVENLSIGVTNLEYCNVEARDVLVSNGCSFVADTLSSECSNVVSGIGYYDTDNNGCTNTDLVISNYFVQSSTSSSSFTSTIAQSGAYEIYLYSEVNHTISLSNIPSYFTVNPETSDIDFSTGATQIVDFCLTANQTANNLNITILPIDDARPGFEATYKLVIENTGTETINNITASLTFDDTKQSFVTSIPVETNASTNNSVDFTLANLNPFQTEYIDIVMQTFTPPTVNGDDVLNFTASVMPNTNDYTPDDNTYQLEQIVVNAYDPNDKRVLQGEFITEDQTDNYLDYIIRFQNTGTANATFVRIEDELDVDLDWSTLKITSASHAYNVEIMNGNEVEFIFDNINLPYEAVDESGSNGFIAYKIKPKNTVQIGDVMSGNASIYFDYNLPIITNTVSTEVTDNLNVNDYAMGQWVTIYPNPTSEGINLKVHNGVSLESAKLFNIQGKLLIEQSDNSNYIDTEKLSSGIYMLSIATNRGNLIKKVMVSK